MLLGRSMCGVIQRIGELLWEELFELADKAKHLVEVVVFSKLTYETFTRITLAGTNMFLHDNFSNLVVLVLFIMLAIFVLAIMAPI
jgi:hypothetical protein